MKVYKTTGGKYVLATYFPSRGRFRTEHTYDGNPCEARSIDDLSDAIPYSHKRSAVRAQKRKHRVVNS